MQINLPPSLSSLSMEESDRGETPGAAAAANHSSNVDASRPFRSVKEAVAIFGERILVPELYSPKPFSFPKQETPFFSSGTETEPSWKQDSASSCSLQGQDAALADTVRKLETELEETKAELVLLKERESETEVALASLNAELHRSMSRAAQAEAAAAAKAAAAAAAAGDEEKKKEQSLKEVLRVGEVEKMVVGRKKEKKKKPIIPLVGELFFSSRKKGASTALHNPLYASSSPFHYN